jgi:hypothetical protein
MITCLVVLLSVLLHGTGIALFMRTAGRASEQVAGIRPRVTETQGEAHISISKPAIIQPARRMPPASDPPPEKITIGEVGALLLRGEPMTIIDARADRSHRADDIQAKGAVRLDPNDPVRSASALRLSQHGTLVIYCA